MSQVADTYIALTCGDHSWLRGVLDSSSIAACTPVPVLCRLAVTLASEECALLSLHIEAGRTRWRLDSPITQTTSLCGQMQRSSPLGIDYMDDPRSSH
jgi:hypothetical protein